MNRRSFLLVAGLSSTAGCLERIQGDNDEIDVRDQVEIVRDDLVRDNPGTEEERVYVWGTVRYDGDRELSLIEIQARFLDEEEEVLQTVVENVRGVDPEDEDQNEWEFQIEYPHYGEEAAEVDAYELEVVTAI